MQQNVGQMKKPRTALDGLVKETEYIRDGELNLKTEKRQGLIEITVDDAKQLDGMRDRRVIHQNMIEYQSLVIAPDKSAANRRRAHDHRGEDHKCDQPPGLSAPWFRGRERSRRFR